MPELAVQWGRDGAFVWIVRDNKAVQVPVQALRRLEGQVLVQPRAARGQADAAALKVGETVVVEGVQRLRADGAVQIVGNGRTGTQDAEAQNGGGMPAASVAPAAGVRP